MATATEARRSTSADRRSSDVRSRSICRHKDVWTPAGGAFCRRKVNDRLSARPPGLRWVVFTPTPNPQASL
jgi:hypothetical protein